MKRAFILTADWHLVSTLVPEETPDALRLGDRVTASRALDLDYAAQIEEGETGTIDFIDTRTGSVEVLMDRVHRGLHRWFNHIWLEPYGTEDIIDGIRVTPQIA